MIQTNKADIVIKGFKEHKCYLINMIILSDNDISSKESDKLYKNMKIEMMKHNHCFSNKND